VGREFIAMSTLIAIVIGIEHSHLWHGSSILAIETTNTITAPFIPPQGKSFLGMLTKHPLDLILVARDVNISKLR
jgi:hypothetical protein